MGTTAVTLAPTFDNRKDRPITISEMTIGRIDPPIHLEPGHYLMVLGPTEAVAIDGHCMVGQPSRVIPHGPERAGREGDSQPMPVINDAPDVQSAVIADIEARRELGIRRYGTALQPHNGRNALLDAYEEAIDLAMYLKQRLIEEAAS